MSQKMTMSGSNTEEIWKDVLGYEGLYRVSNLGRVWGYYNKSILKGQISNTGYLRVTLYLEGVPKVFSIHRLMLTAFVRPPVEGEVCNHIDGDRLNNKLENLEWTTVSGNLKHAHKLGLVNQTGEKNPSSTFSDKICEQIIELLQTNMPIKEIVQITGVKAYLISNVNRGTTHKHISQKLGLSYPIRPSSIVEFTATREELKDLQERGLKVREIAEKYGVTIPRVERRLYAK